MIVALCIVSASDIAFVMKEFTYQWAAENKEDFDNLLYKFGMDTRFVYEEQDGEEDEKGKGIQHMNRQNKVVKCKRWVGVERTDEEWLKSGHASREAKDKASGSKLLADLYNQKGYRV